MDSRLDLARGTKDLGGANESQFRVCDPDSRPAGQKATLRNEDTPRLRSDGQVKNLGAFGIGQLIRSGSRQRRDLTNFPSLLSVQYSPQQLGKLRSFHGSPRSAVSYQLSRRGGSAFSSGTGNRDGRKKVVWSLKFRIALARSISLHLFES